MAEPSKKKQRRHLNYDKCRCCRQAKKACIPTERIWPQKCHRCSELELECSENTRAAGAPRLVTPQPVSQVVKATDTQELHDLSLRVTWLRRLKLYQKTVEATVEAREKLFDLASEATDPQLPWKFIRDEEVLLSARFLDENIFSNNPLAALVVLSCDTEAATFRDRPLLPSYTPAPKAIVDRLRGSGDIGTALVLQEIILLDKCNEREKEISAAELQEYCETYTQTWERLEIITGDTGAVPVLPPLHNLLLLTQGKVRFPSNLSQIRSQDYLGRSLLHLALDLGVAEDVLRYMKLDQNATVPSDYWGRLPVHIACSGNSEAVAEYFLENNVDIGVTDVFGSSALHYAAASGNVKTVQMLLGRGASVDCKDVDGCSPLVLAAIRGHTAIVQVLALNGADVNIGWNHKTPLSVAAKKGHKATVKLLFDVGADINPPLFWAAREGHIDIVRIFLETGVDVNSEDNDGNTLTFRAIQCGRRGIVQLLLEKGANVGSKNKFGYTPLYEAVRYGHAGIVRLLLEHGADLKTEPPDFKSLELAILKGHEDIAEILRAAGGFWTS